MGDFAHSIDWQDGLALLFFVLCWLGYAGYADHASHYRSSLLAVTNRYRLQWLREMMRRDNRSLDIIMAGNLQRSITFFASTTIFLLIGMLGLLGYHDRASAILGNIPFAKPNSSVMWELKIFMLIVLFIYAFFKCTWSMRQYNYAMIFIAAAPPHNERLEEHEGIAARGAFLVGNAAKHFNNALRAYYYGLGALAWFVHPYLFMAATTLVVFVLFRREYRSSTLRNLAHT